MYFTPDDALRHARAWIAKHPKWMAYGDLPDEPRARVLLDWSEITEGERRAWREQYRDEAESCWREFCSNRPYRNRYGFMSGLGVFYPEITDVPFGHNSMMMIEIGGKDGRYYSGGMGVKSGLPRQRKGVYS